VGGGGTASHIQPHGSLTLGGGSVNSSIVWSVGDPRQSLNGAARGSATGGSVRGASITGGGATMGPSYSGVTGGVTGAVGRSSPVPGVTPAAPPLTTYCLSSLVAISQELLPIPRIAAARAAADIELTAGVCVCG
jgi:hypothetical protein